MRDLGTTRVDDIEFEHWEPRTGGTIQYGEVHVQEGTYLFLNH
jgi:hypothetical protein